MRPDLAAPVIRIVIVDDDFLIQAYLTEIAEQMGFIVAGTAGTAAEAVALVARERPDVVLMDVRLGTPPDGIDAAQEMRARGGPPVVFITGSTDPATAERMAAVKPLAVLSKPILPEQLGRALRRCNSAPA